MNKPLFAAWIAVIVALAADAWRSLRIVMTNQYWDIPAWQGILFWGCIAVIASAAVATAIAKWKGRKLGYVLIPAGLLLGLAAAITGLSMFVCHGSGCTETALVVWPGSMLCGAIAIYTLVEGIRLAKAPLHGDEAV